MAFANADSDLNTAWSTLTPAKKKELLPSQRQWIKTKDAMCGKVSMQGTDAEVKKMVDCQTQMTLSRTAFSEINSGTSFKLVARAKLAPAECGIISAVVP